MDGMLLAPHFHVETVAFVLFCLESDDLRPSPWWQRFTHPSGPRLRSDLAIDLQHLAMESTIEIGIVLGGVIVIPQLYRCVSIEFVKPHHLRSIWFREPIDGIAVQREGNRFPLPDDLLQVNGSDMVVVVISAPAVPTELI
jgi:hypothetical protein